MYIMAKMSFFLVFFYQTMLSQGAAMMFPTRKQVQLRLDDSDWSKAFDVVGLSSGLQGVVSMQQTKEAAGESVRKLYEVGILRKRGKAEYKLTMVATVAPRYIFVNRLHTKVLVKQVDTSDWISLEVDEHIPFSWTDSAKKPKLQLKIASVGEKIWGWSHEFSIAQLGDFHVKTRRQNVAGSSVTIHVEAVTIGASVLVSFQKSDAKHPPFKITNNTHYNLRFRQKGMEAIDAAPAMHSVPYVWDDPFIDGKRATLLEVLLPQG